jgi:hemolysin D
MLIVPRGEKLEAEVDVENKDIGFVRVGQKAEIKIDTFPYTRYGIIDAQITGITKDAVENKDAATGQSKTLVYKMQLTMAKSSLWVDGKDVELGPGMAVTAEVKTGKRRLIEYFLSPLIQHVGESVRER